MSLTWCLLTQERYVLEVLYSLLMLLLGLLQRLLFSEQLIIRVSSLGVDVLGLSVEDDVSDGLLRGVEKEPNSTSVCVPKSPVGGGGGGGGALDLQCRQCPYFF